VGNEWAIPLEFRILIALKCKLKGYLKYNISVSSKCKSKHIFPRLFIAVFINNDLLKIKYF
jgi:hypothetical protein